MNSFSEPNEIVHFNPHRDLMNCECSHKMRANKSDELPNDSVTDHRRFVRIELSAEKSRRGSQTESMHS